MRRRAWLMFALSQSLSAMGSQWTNFALPWLLLQRTGSGAQLGAAFALETVVYVLAPIPAGVWMDRRNRRRSMVTADLLRALCVVSIPAAAACGVLTTAWLYVALILMNVLSAWFDAGYGTVMPQLVSAQSLASANAWLQAGQAVALLTGPVVGSLWVSLFGPAPVMALDAATYLTSAAALAWLPEKSHKRGGTADEGSVPDAAWGARLAAAMRGAVRDAAEGMRVIRQQPLLRKLSITAALVNIWSDGVYTAAFYVLQRATREGMAAGIAGVVLTGVGMGALVGSLVAVRCGRYWRQRWPWRACGLLLLLSTLALLAFPAATWAIGGALVLESLAIEVWNTLATTARQLAVPDALLARTMTFSRTLAWAARPVGSAGAGALAQTGGLRPVASVATLLQLLALVVCWRIDTPAVHMMERAGTGE